MPSIHSAYPSNYVRAVDLGSRRAAVTITHLNMEDVGGDGERKPVLYFKGTEKGLVLNKTNASSIIEIAGTDDYAKWGGVKVVLFATTTDFKGKTVDCIRIAAPAGTKPEPEPEPEMEAPPEGDDRVPF